MDFLNTFLSSSTGISEWAFIVLCLASFFTSVISAAFGLGGGAMLISIIASLMPPIAIIPVHAVIQVSSNFSRATMMWRHIKYTWMTSFVLGTIIGATIGGQIVFALPANLLKGIIGLFILYSLWGPSTGVSSASRKTFFGVGVVSSFATMFVGGSGPLIAPFVRATTSERRMTVATHAAFMSWQHGVKILTFGFLGFSFAPYISLIVSMILFGIVGTWSGKTILLWMPEQIFRKAFSFVLTVLALRLLYESLADMLV
ncbi:MAG: sulfite exporter TauE/SafE family protein [Chloroflexota bacterium]|nr:sulfite exporter TauE/SafE family protein [Chloroflexota bacterium]